MKKYFTYIYIAFLIIIVGVLYFVKDMNPIIYILLAAILFIFTSTFTYTKRHDYLSRKRNTKESK